MKAEEQVTAPPACFKESDPVGCFLFVCLFRAALAEEKKIVSVIGRAHLNKTMPSLDSFFSCLSRSSCHTSVEVRRVHWRCDTFVAAGMPCAHAQRNQRKEKIKQTFSEYSPIHVCILDMAFFCLVCNLAANAWLGWVGTWNPPPFARQVPSGRSIHRRR